MKNYLITTWRNLYRQPYSNVLNLICLTAGITSSLLILLYVDFEVQYDRFNSKADRIYQVRTTALNLGERVRKTEMTGSPRNLSGYIETDIPEVEASVRLFRFFQDSEVGLAYKDKEVKTEHIYASDPSIFDIFSIDLTQGDAISALRGPNKVVLSEALAHRLFENKSAVGEIIESELVHSLPNSESSYPLFVTGIFEDLPKNSHITLEALVSAETDPRLSEWDFGHFNTLTYLLLKPESNPEKLADNLTTLYEKYLNPIKEPVLTSAVHELVPLAKIHSRDTGGRTYLFILISVALLILLISVISFVNLATAQGSRRSKEVGIRKVLGSSRRQLVQQFTSESMAYVVLSMLFANFLVWQFVEPMNKLLGLRLVSGRLWEMSFLPGMIAVSLILGLFAGAYPAFFLSAFNPFNTMRKQGSKTVPIRRLLIATQFAILIFVLSCTGMIYQQLKFLQEKDLGFNHDRVLFFELGGNEWKQDYTHFREELERIPQVASVGTSSFIPGIGEMGRRPISADGTSGTEPQFVFWGSFDYDYPSVLGMELIEGRFFSKEFPGDVTTSVIVNEAFLLKFGIEQPAVGKRIKFGDNGNPNSETIVGVIKDFHHASLHNPIAPQIFLLDTSPRVFARMNSSDESSIASLHKAWQITFDHTPFDFKFIDSTLLANYENEEVQGRIFIFFSCLTVLIAFLGLFGLCSYLTQQRTKEIGIRKTLGAGLPDLVSKMSREYIRLVLIAAVPALLLALFFIQEWFKEFAFHATIDPWYLGLVVLFTTLVTLLTCGWHTTIAALRNPAENLRQE